MVLLRRGRAVFDGPKRSILTSANLTSVYEAPVVLDEVDDYYHARA